MHRNVKYLLTAAGQETILPTLPKLSCPFKKTKQEFVETRTPPKRTIEDEFKDFKHFVDPEYQKYQNVFEPKFSSTSSTNNVYNVNNDNKCNSEASEATTKSPAEGLSEKEQEEAAIDDAIRQLAHIVGELEFQMGIESVMAGHYDDAVDHFKLSTSHKHPGGVFNLGICYEQGVGVKKSLKTAKQLYEVASELGHAKATYNLGVFHAQGLGGARKNFYQAKKYFEQGAQKGNMDAQEALNMLLPKPKKLPIVIEIPEDDFFYMEKSNTKSISAMANQSMMRIAVT